MTHITLKRGDDLDKVAQRYIINPGLLAHRCELRHAPYRIIFESFTHRKTELWRSSHPVMEQIEKLELNLAEMMRHEGAAIRTQEQLKEQISSCRRVILLAAAKIHDAHIAGLIPDTKTAIQVAQWYAEEYQEFETELRRRLLTGTDLPDQLMP